MDSNIARSIEVDPAPSEAREQVAPGPARVCARGRVGLQAQEREREIRYIYI